MTRVTMIGATGLVGGEVVPRLVAAGHAVTLVGRRNVCIAGADARVAAVRDWPLLIAALPCDLFVSTLGTTRRQAGDWAGLAAIDRDAQLAAAGAARRAGASRAIIVSSVGANPASRSPYLRIKGEMEAGLQALGFERLDLLRPGLLLGARGGPARPGERVAVALSPLVNPLLKGKLSRVAAIPAATVAAAMARLAEDSVPGLFVHDNRAIRALASSVGSDRG